MSAQLSRVGRPVILMYHRIADEPFDPWGIAVSPDNFAEQVRWLAQGRTLLSLPQFADLHRSGQIPDDAVAVTFDDGYACTAKIAAPLLDRFRVPATIFIAAGMHGRVRLFWWDELAQIVMTYPGTTIRVLDRTFGLGERQRGDRAWPRDNRKRTARQQGFYAVWAALQPLPSEKIEEALAEMRGHHASPAADETHRLMTPDEMRSISSPNIEFGSHAMTHASLPSLTRHEKAREIRDSIGACEQLVGARPISFAYPFGDYDRESRALVADAGFACACSVEGRAVAPGDDIFALPRIKVGNWTGRRLGRELAQIGYAAAKGT